MRAEPGDDGDGHEVVGQTVDLARAKLRRQRRYLHEASELAIIGCGKDRLDFRRAATGAPLLPPVSALWHARVAISSLNRVRDWVARVHTSLEPAGFDDTLALANLVAVLVPVGDLQAIVHLDIHNTGQDRTRRAGRNAVVGAHAEHVALVVAGAGGVLGAVFLDLSRRSLLRRQGRVATNHTVYERLKLQIGSAAIALSAFPSPANFGVAERGRRAARLRGRVGAPLIAVVALAELVACASFRALLVGHALADDLAPLRAECVLGAAGGPPAAGGAGAPVR